MRRSLALPILGAFALAASPAAADTLTNGTGDGKVTVGVSGAGTFGTNAVGGGSATYDPVGSIPAASTTYNSAVFFRIGNSGSMTNLSTTPATVTSSSATSVTSNFSTGGLDFNLVQTLSDLVSGTTQTGSLLTQTYTFTNNTGADIVLDLTRYIDGDLRFDGNISDGGGRLIVGGREILFETDSATGSADSATFLGIFAEGGTSTGYEITQYSTLLSHIQNGLALGNSIANDGADADQFIDAGQGYDVALGLGRSFTLAAGATGTFTTGTIFGSGAPQDVQIPSAVPEPSTWAMMILGFGLIGAAARRRRSKAAIA